MKYYLAIDIGASSGRHIIGYLENGVLQTEEMYRFKNGVSELDGHLVWDIDYLFTQVKEGIKESLKKYPNIESVSIDTWGVDYALLDKDDHLIRPVFAYRDQRTKEVIDKVHNIIPFDELYKITGSQFQEFNTIYQLYSDKLLGRLDIAEDFLMIPEYLMYKLTGVKCHEYTNASTTGMLNLVTNSYDSSIIERLGFNKLNFTSLSKPGTFIGYFTKEIQDEVSGNMKVVLCPTHDTASAVESISMKERSLYLSSGTWSLLGAKLDKGISSKESLLANFSNEYGPNYIRYQKNIMGLWIIQGLQKQIGLSFSEMVELSKQSNYQEMFDVNDAMFLSSLNMKKTITNWFSQKGITPPLCDADFILTTYRSLALSYQKAILEIENITSSTYDNLYIVGGGAKNTFLNELTKEFTLKNVIAKPIEATAIGNLMTQIKGDKI